MFEQARHECRILIVDDQELNVALLEQMLRGSGYRNLRSTRDPREVVSLWQEFQPDLILLDLHMPHLDGFAVLQQLTSLLPKGEYLPVLVVTADMLPAAKQRALGLGAKDFLTKPYDNTEVLLRIRNLLETRFLYRELQGYNQTLEQKVSERTQDLEQAQIEMLERLALASESRDDDTGEHTKRVGEMAASLAQMVGWSKDEVNLMRRAAALHDIGKIGIPDRILLKPGKLTPEEFESMKTHTALGARILAGSRFPILQLAEQIAFYHHEKWDGGGYYQVAREEIPLAARIVAIADVFDVLTHARPYKEAWPIEDALSLIERQSGSHFDPQLVECFLQLRHGQGLVILGHALQGQEAAGGEPQISTEHLMLRR